MVIVHVPSLGWWCGEGTIDGEGCWNLVVVVVVGIEPTTMTMPMIAGMVVVVVVCNEWWAVEMTNRGGDRAVHGWTWIPWSPSSM